MKMRRLTWVLILLLAGATRAVNTEAPLSGQSQQGLIGHVGSEGAPGQSLGVSGPSEGVLPPGFDMDPDLSSVLPVDPLASLAAGDKSLAGPSAGGLIHGFNTADWTTGHHWSTDPKRYTDAGFVDASSRVDLPAFAEIDWVATPLPTARRASLMEILVFPALGALVVISLLGVLIARLRRRKSLSQAEQLLHV